MNKIILIAIFSLILIVGGYFLLSGENQTSQISTEQTVPSSEQVSIEQEVVDNQSQGGNSEGETIQENQKEIKEFVVVGTNFTFSLDEIRVAKGDTVRIVFKNNEGVHDWKIDGLGITTQVIQAGQEEVIEFMADKTGEFEFYCSVGNHRDLGMLGKLIVE